MSGHQRNPNHVPWPCPVCKERADVVRTSYHVNEQGDMRGVRQRQRRRECRGCGHRFTTAEVLLETVELAVRAQRELHRLQPLLYADEGE